MLRFIKPEHADVKKLIKQIATTSATGATLLEQFAKDDPTIKLDDISLPPGETATRDAIASTKEKELLGQTGDTFELTLLMTQTEALSYLNCLFLDRVCAAFFPAKSGRTTSEGRHRSSR